MAAYFNEIDPFCADVLRRRIADGSLPPGDVDERDIRSVRADEIGGYDQWHLFAGIGGFPLGFRMAGVADDFPVLTGGFPCQPFSAAGQRRGASDDRHLWPEMLRLVAALRPAWVLGENVAGIVSLALDGVLSDLEGAGYACWPAVIPACAVDAPHRRDRVWIVAYCDGRRCQGNGRHQKPQGWATSDVASQHQGGGDVEHAARQLPHRGGIRGPRRRGEHSNPGGAEPVGDAGGAGLAQRLGEPGDDGTEQPAALRTGGGVWSGGGWLAGGDGKLRRVPEPGIRLLADGIPGRVARLKALGNAVVPQVVAEIARAMAEAGTGDQASDIRSLTSGR